MTDTATGSEVSSWRALEDEIGRPAHRTAEALQIRADSLSALEAYFAIKSASDVERLQATSHAELTLHVQQVLNNLRVIRDAAQEDIRDLIEWSGQNTDMSTYSLGRAAGLSASTVNRMRKPPLAS